MADEEGLRRKASGRSGIKVEDLRLDETSSALTGWRSAIRRGRVIRALAMAMRWRWPPEDLARDLPGGRPSPDPRPPAPRWRAAAALLGGPMEDRRGLGHGLQHGARVERAVGVLEDHLHLRARAAQVPAGA
jgi:hypothetical protein